MKRIAFLPVLFVLGMTSTSGQQSKKAGPLLINDPVPEIKFSKIINYKSATARLSEFKNKVVILDFWAPWCSPCVAGLPNLSALQEKYKKDIMVLLVSGIEPESSVKQFFEKKKNLAMPNVICSRDHLIQLRKLFPHTGIPHSVIIGKTGKVLALTTSEHINDKIIDKAIKGEPLGLQVKLDNMTFRSNKPILEDNNAGVKPEMIMYSYQSVLTTAIPGIGTESSRITTDSLKKGRQMMNHRFGHLFGCAYGDETLWRYRMICEDPRYKEELNNRNRQFNHWTYEYITSLNMSDSAILQRMKMDLNDGFGVQTAFEKRLLPCFKLTVVDSAKIIKSDSDFAQAGMNGEIASYYNYNMAEIADHIGSDIYYPVSDHTNIPYRMKELPLSKSAFNAWRGARHDIEPLRRELQNSGLDLVSGQDYFEVLVIKPR